MMLNFKSSKEVMKMFNISCGMITHYARMFGVEKFERSYYWTPEQIEKVRQRVGQAGHAIKSDFKRFGYRKCNDCPDCIKDGKKRTCKLSGEIIRANCKTSPINCPKGQRLKACEVCP